ncbi:hypothetical protein DB2_30 [Octadecabacter Antarctic DB virus 2]|nr:hypothetical protein DB2_30 [Octadecabacter Antarctic DB virus 2]
MINRFISWLYITRMWGPRCPDFDEACCTCRAWESHDDTLNERHVWK